MQQIQIFPRRLLASFDPERPAAIISITDLPPHGEPATIPTRSGIRHVLRLAFNDFCPPRHCPWGKTATGKTVAEEAMTAAQAQQLATFVLAVAPKVDILAVHCEAAASRSPSVALAVADALLGRKEVLLFLDHGFDKPVPLPRGFGAYDRTLHSLPAPNEYVYWMCFNALLEAIQQS